MVIRPAALQGKILKLNSQFNFIIIDDCSKDLSLQLINDISKNDKRIIIIKNKENIGLTKSLNKGIGISKGKYIARIDAGDLWDVTKLEKQIKFLDDNISPELYDIMEKIASKYNQNDSEKQLIEIYSNYITQRINLFQNVIQPIQETNIIEPPAVS